MNFAISLVVVDAEFTPDDVNGSSAARDLDTVRAKQIVTSYGVHEYNIA